MRVGARVRAFAAFVWDFVVGDDWRTAVGVTVALGVTALAAGSGLTAWWIMPVCALGLLGASLWRAAGG